MMDGDGSEKPHVIQPVGERDLWLDVGKKKGEAKATHVSGKETLV
jgi:hypothetical protein